MFTYYLYKYIHFKIITHIIRETLYYVRRIREFLDSIFARIF